MDATHQFTTAILIRKLESSFTLTSDERQALETLPMQITAIKEGQDIVRQGDRPSRSCLILSGFTCTYKMTGDGKRQIHNFQIPGDIPDLQSLHLKVLDNSLGTITPCSVGFITHEDLHKLCKRHYRIASAFWRETLIDGAVFREWMTSIGQREAYPRIAHLMCEMLERLRAVGLVNGYSCEFPITQSEIADALGITPVHVNRVVKAMRADGLIELKGERLNIPDWETLKKAGDFDPTYLHLESHQAAA
ncbi:Crp/Fnr family transcriptional regulator [Microvirga lenta]|uniref:Crp/Fnr family transcriptional regulator n=1 Tax=Microvirga lenta TaxID=2881337 RepID=UPI001CFE4264|nr:Crp/Fnr family transcriptional regulator [Microvirga lenta]MCB5173914.1 Crp/Fnr family transcriptional regulator [Microvirga lenta]